ncbi:MAG TPA: hypothetical protein VMF06_20145 [Candidatus Limnocylindria bacterium]|jgi:hypothetical protein|nr:hypothetical protein [Candidatus Limnocylindria bacterium]
MSNPPDQVDVLAQLAGALGLLDSSSGDVKASRDFLRMVAIEFARAEAEYPRYHSLHEGESILREEFEEFWDEVKLKASKRDPVRIAAELVQIAAVALRIYVSCVAPKEGGR